MQNYHLWNILLIWTFKGITTMHSCFISEALILLCFCRFEIMQKCWSEEPSGRLGFEVMVDMINKIAGKIEHLFPSITWWLFCTFKIKSSWCNKVTYWETEPFSHYQIKREIILKLKMSLHSLRSLLLVARSILHNRMFEIIEDTCAALLGINNKQYINHLYMNFFG